MKTYEVITDIKGIYYHKVEADSPKEAKEIAERLSHEEFDNGDFEMDTDSQVNDLSEE